MVLRAWRGGDIGVAMALCGSFSMAWLQREHGVMSDHVNDCLPIDVEELSPEGARAMLEAMIAHEKIPAETGFADALLALLPSFYPGVVQFAFSVVRDKPPLTLARLDTVFADKIAEGLDTNYYAQFDKRHDRYDTAERTAADQLFNALVAAEAGSIARAEAERLLGDGGRTLLDHLAEDGFLRASRTRGVRFASNLARQWFEGPG